MLTIVQPQRLLRDSSPYTLVFADLLKVLDKDKRCFGCARHVDSAEMAAVRANVVKTIENNSNEKSRKAEAELVVYTQGLATLRALESSAVASTRIKDVDLPNLTLAISDYEVKLGPATAAVEQVSPILLVVITCSEVY